jgi:hypothetical protein
MTETRDMAVRLRWAAESGAGKHVGIAQLSLEMSIMADPRATWDEGA